MSVNTVSIHTATCCRDEGCNDGAYGQRSRQPGLLAASSKEKGNGSMAREFLRRLSTIRTLHLTYIQKKKIRWFPVVLLDIWWFLSPGLWYEYNCGPETLVFVFGGTYQFLRYFYETFRRHFWRLFQDHKRFFCAPRCRAAFLDTSACGVATTQLCAPLPSTQLGWWYIRLVWI
jgi:hypothetical protein